MEFKPKNVYPRHWYHTNNREFSGSAQRLNKADLRLIFWRESNTNSKTSGNHSNYCFFYNYFNYYYYLIIYFILFLFL